jgi:hypothetical protein
MGASPHIGDDRLERSASIDDWYDAVLAALLAEAVRPPGVLNRLRSTLMRLHHLRQTELEGLPLEYWYWH